MFDARRDLRCTRGSLMPYAGRPLVHTLKICVGHIRPNYVGLCLLVLHMAARAYSYMHMRRRVAEQMDP